MISEIANIPVISGISPMPPIISTLPNVKRGNPAGLPSPKQARSRFKKSAMVRLQAALAELINTAQVQTFGESFITSKPCSLMEIESSFRATNFLVVKLTFSLSRIAGCQQIIGCFLG